MSDGEGEGECIDSISRGVQQQQPLSVLAEERESSHVTPDDDVNTLLEGIRSSREERSTQKLKALHEENARLSSSLEKAEDSIVAIRRERDKFSSENQVLRDSLFDCQTKTSAATDGIGKDYVAAFRPGSTLSRT